MTQFVFKNLTIGFKGESLGQMTETTITFGYSDVLVRKRKKDISCEKIGDIIDIPKYTSNFICVLETYELKILSFLSLDYKKKNKLVLGLRTDFTFTDSKTPPVYRRDDIGEYDIYECTDKIYADCIHALILAKERKEQIKNERRY